MEPEMEQTITVPGFHGGFVEHHQAQPLTREEYYLRYGERMVVPPISAWERKMAERNRLGLPAWKATVTDWENFDAWAREVQREKDGGKLQREVERLYEIEDHQLENLRLDGPLAEFVQTILPARTARRQRAYAVIFQLTTERRTVFLLHGRVVVAPPADPDIMREVVELELEIGHLLDEWPSRRIDIP